MRKLLFLVLAILIANISFSQVYKGSEADAIAEGADIVRMLEHTKVPDYIHFRNDVNLNQNKAITYISKFFTSESIGLEFHKTQKNNTSDQTIRYFQTYRGIPVEFTALNMQMKNNRVYAINGNLLDDINVVFSFSLTEEAALQNALSYIGADTYMWESQGEEDLLKDFTKDSNATYYPSAEKVIVSNCMSLKDNKEFKTAYKFNIYAKSPHSRKNVYVDAISGDILFDVELLHSSDEVGTAETVYSGTRDINTEFNGTNYVLTDNTRGDGVRTLNCEMGTDYEAAVEFTDDDNYWNNVNADLDEYATDAQFATMSTYDYFYNVHGRSSIDGNGYQLWSFIHFNLIDYGYGTNVNAFWNGQWMTYGDGDPGNGTTPLTTIDICAHEITHGLTSYTCNLNYQDESGALNEAFSDIFGSAVEFTLHLLMLIGQLVKI
jgi:bacillolysin